MFAPEVTIVEDHIAAKHQQLLGDIQITSRHASCWAVRRVGEVRVQRSLFWASLLALGSFIMATPMLLAGWLRQRAR